MDSSAQRGLQFRCYLQERRIQQNLHAEEKKIQMELAHQNAIRYGLCARCFLEANMRPIIGPFPLSCVLTGDWLAGPQSVGVVGLAGH